MVPGWLTARDEWKFFSVLPKADGSLAAAWWTLLLLRGALPAIFALAMGALIGAVQRQGARAVPLAALGTAYILLQVLPPLHQAISANFGSRVAAWLNDQLAATCIEPPGI